MPRRGVRLRKPHGRGEHIAAGIVTVAAVTLPAEVTAALWGAVARSWPYLITLAVAALAYGLRCALRVARARRARAAVLGIPRMPLADLDAMNDGRFEEAARDLLIRDGWSARRAGRQGDRAADVIGRHPQRGRIVVQAKHTRVGGKVGAPVMYQVKGTAGPVHRADHAVVITNGGVTWDTKAWGERHRIGWIDRDRLRAWAEDGTPLHVLVRLPARPRRREPSRDAAA